jgi:hypothetical protein
MITTFLGFVIGPSATGALSEWIGNGADPLRWPVTIIIPSEIVSAVLGFSASHSIEQNRQMPGKAAVPS